jgi:hypothetical protein
MESLSKMALVAAAAILAHPFVSASSLPYSCKLLQTGQIQCGSRWMTAALVGDFNPYCSTKILSCVEQMFEHLFRFVLARFA